MTALVVTAPGVLPESAKSVYLTAFASSYKANPDNPTLVGREAIAASDGWSAVKEKFEKNADGKWVEKSFSDAGIEAEGVPLPGSLLESPFGAGLTWISAFQERYEDTRDLAEASTFAWTRLKANYSQSAESGLWTPKSVDLLIVSRPFGDWETFDDCVAAIMEKNPSYDEETAKATCGKIKAETERAFDWDSCVAKHREEGMSFEEANEACDRMKSGSGESADELTEESFEVRRLPSVGAVRGGGALIVDGLLPEQEDILLMRGYGAEQAAMPEGMSEFEWIARPAGYRTVERVIRDKKRYRAYKTRVAQFISNYGAVVRQNPSNNGELILTLPAKFASQDKIERVTGILTHKSDLSGFEPDHWDFRPLSTGYFRGSLATLRVPANEMRFRGPVLK